jgi:ElaB/YqjD/DUF883 family membrane-anchored ribosome-binding protein
MKSSVAQETKDTMADVAGERAKEYVDKGVETYNAVAGRSRAVGRQVDGYVRENPWIIIGAAAGVGLLLGLVIRRR